MAIHQECEYQGEHLEGYQLREYLSRRFFITDDRAAYPKFYDLELDQNGLMQSNLVGVAMHLGKMSYDDAKQLVRHVYFNTLAPTKLYRPGQPPVINQMGVLFLNSWVAPRFDTETPGELSAEPFISHLERALGKEAAMYLLDVLSYRLQHPNDKKPHIAFYFYHETGGMGKSLFLETLRNVLGQNSVNTINTTDRLNSMSAAELWNTSWLAIEEAGVAKGSKIYDTIKSYTGADQVDADAKHKGFGKKEIPAMLMLMSNRAPTFIEAHDRRFFVKEWFVQFDETETKDEYFAQYTNWLEKEGGYQAIYQYLINHQVTQDIRKVPVTREKEMAMDMSCNPVVTEIKDYLEDNKKYWCFNIECFDEIFNKHRVNSNQRKHLLVEAGLVKDGGRYRINNNRYRLWVREGVYTKGIGSGTAAFYNGRDDFLNEVTLISHSRHY